MKRIRKNCLEDIAPSLAKEVVSRSCTSNQQRTLSSGQMNKGPVTRKRLPCSENHRNSLMQQEVG